MLQRNIKQGRWMRSLMGEVEVLYMLVREDLTEMVTIELRYDQRGQRR